MDWHEFGFSLGKVPSPLQFTKPRGIETESTLLQLLDYLLTFLTRSRMDCEYKTNVLANAVFRWHDAYLEIINASRFEFLA